MGSYDSMKSRLQPTGLYALDGNSAVDWELQAYAAGIDPIRATLETLRGESFVATASAYGLRFREAACGLIDLAQEDDGRRKALYALGAVTPNSCSKADLEGLLAALGITAQVTEDVPGKKITIDVSGEEYGHDGDWRQIIGRFLPAHLDVVWNNSSGK